VHPGSQPPDRPAPEQDDRRAQVARIGPQVFEFRAVLSLDLGTVPQPLPELVGELSILAHGACKSLRCLGLQVRRRPDCLPRMLADS